MNQPQYSPLEVTRRHFFRDCGIGVGKIALAGLLAESLGRPAAAGAASPGVRSWPAAATFLGRRGR